jgi:hypothetical protein
MKAMVIISSMEATMNNSLLIANAVGAAHV